MVRHRHPVRGNLRRWRCARGSRRTGRGNGYVRGGEHSAHSAAKHRHPAHPPRRAGCGRGGGCRRGGAGAAWLAGGLRGGAAGAARSTPAPRGRLGAPRKRARAELALGGLPRACGCGRARAAAARLRVGGARLPRPLARTRQAALARVSRCARTGPLAPAPRRQRAGRGGSGRSFSFAAASVLAAVAASGRAVQLPAARSGGAAQVLPLRAAARPAPAPARHPRALRRGAGRPRRLRTPAGRGRCGPFAGGGERGERGERGKRAPPVGGGARDGCVAA
mmetsp:Transcript_29604/g.74446  ORF Transcript_29604/g.74446 Transcript_29604/m.74446 type:complete len:279 (+) Transcript_29604:816-1652(+)